MSLFEKLTPEERAISAIKSTTLERIEMEMELELKIYSLQLEYQEKFKKFEDKINKFAHGGEIEKEDCAKFINHLGEPKVTEEFSGKPSTDYKPSFGFPGFWLKALKNNPSTSEMIKDVDEPILAYLTNIRVIQVNPDAPLLDYPEVKDRAIIIEFHFKPNPYFINPVLYKIIKLGFVVDKSEIFDFDGLIPLSVDYSEIKWAPDMNVTVKQVKKTQKNKKTKQIRVVTKSEKVPSFFGFFSKNQISDVDDCESETEAELVLRSILYAEYDLITQIQTEFIPKVILYYLGEIEGEEDDLDDECCSHGEYSEDCDDHRCNKRGSDGFL